MAKKSSAKESQDSLQKSVKELTSAIKELTNLFYKAAEEPSADEQELKKLDTLIAHNEDLANAMLLLLELNRENLPKIAEELKERPRQQPAERPMQIQQQPQIRTQLQPLQPRYAPQQQLNPPLPQELDLELPEFEETKKKKGLF